MFDKDKVRTEEIKRKNDGTTATQEPEPAPAAQRGPAGPSAGQDQPRHGPHFPIIDLVVRSKRLRRWKQEEEAV